MMRLTPKEREVLPYIAVLCLSSKETAQVMHVSNRTIEEHRENIIRKYKVKNIRELIRYVALREPRAYERGKSFP